MFKLFYFSVCVAAASAMMCPPDYCQGRNCTAVTNENCNGKVRHNGGFCLCCDVCITQLAEGAKCMSFPLFGVPQLVECADELSCDSRTGTCERSHTNRATSLCHKRLAEVEATYAANSGMTGLERPHCEKNGLYKGMQFSGSQAYCVTSNGTMVYGYMVNRWETVDTRGDDMNCKCARDEFIYKKSGLMGRSYYCFKNGNYADVGCLGSKCYCQDGMGKHVGTTTVNIWEQNSINC